MARGPALANVATILIRRGPLREAAASVDGPVRSPEHPARPRTPACARTAAAQAASLRQVRESLPAARPVDLLENQLRQEQDREDAEPLRIGSRDQGRPEVDQKQDAHHGRDHQRVIPVQGCVADEAGGAGVSAMTYAG